MAFDIVKYLEKNKIELGTVKKAVGDNVFKGGHNDLRKTSYDVKITENGKLDLYTHKEILTEGVKYPSQNEESNPVRKAMRIIPSAFKYLIVVQKEGHEPLEVAKFRAQGDAILAARALNKKSGKEYTYRITDI